MKKHIIVPLLALLTISLSCNERTDKPATNTWKATVEENISNLMGKKLELPKDSVIGNLKQDYKNIPFSVTDYKIVTYVDATCGTCLKDLDFWNNFIKETREKKIDCEFKMYVYSNDYEEFQDSIANKMGLIYPYTIDNKSAFPTINRIPDKRFQTALLNKKNEVVLLGYPVLNKNLRNLYIKTLTDFAKD